MRLISPLLKRVVYPGLSKSGYLLRVANTGLAVVTYHGIRPEGYAPRYSALDDNLLTADAFGRQLRLLKSKYNVISPVQFLHWGEGDLELPPRSVLLTCDDGLLNTLTDMLPILQRFNLPCLFFVTGGSVGDVSSMLWYERLYLCLLRAKREVSILLPSQPPVLFDRGAGRIHSAWLELTKRLSVFDADTREQILHDVRTQIGISSDWESEYSQNQALRRRFFTLNVHELRELQNAGMTIGAHTMSHPMLSRMTEKLAFDEIAQSRTSLETALGSAVWALAFPFGNSATVNVREQELAKRAGFKFAFMNVEDGSVENRFALPRIHVSSNMTLAEFDAHVSGFYRSIRDRFSHPANTA
jgi:peptidoglycan/xylan/chitin deacetylase (PgdA/CDA1 family)